MQTKLSVFCSKIIEAGWLAAVVAVPLFFNIYTARTFEPDKITLLRSLVSIMVLAWIVKVVEQGVGNTGDGAVSFADRVRGLFKIPLFLPTSFLVIIYVISTIFSISPQVSLWGSYQRMQGTYSALSYIVVFALIIGNLHTREQVDRLVTTIIIASVPVSLYGIVQRYGLDPLPWAGDVTQRVASTMGNAIFVASYLIMVIPLTFSRLVESMTTIIKEKETSWGHTVLAAIYIFILAIQFITVLFSQSRGPMLGVLGAFFVMGLLLILLLRHLDPDRTGLSLKEVGTGIFFVVPLGLTGGLGGVAGYFVGLGIENLLFSLNYQVDNLSLLGAALGGLLGFLGLYVYMAASYKGWRWLWLSWIGIAVLAIAFVVTLNIRGTALDPYLDPVRQLPYVSRLGKVITTGGTGKVRILIWDAAMELVAPHQPLGIEGDNLAATDRFNVIRPLIGYGPESMFNAFAYVYPPDLAHVEARGSSADRSHNETMDSLVITGVLGFAAFYWLMVSLFYYSLLWLRWVPDRAAKQRLIILLILGGIIGIAIPYFADGSLTFAPVGLPFGLIAGMVIYLVWQGIIRQKQILGKPEETEPDQVEQSVPDVVEETGENKTKYIGYDVLLIGLLGATIGHFIEVHFVFSIAATYTYFWVYVGLMVALAKIRQLEIVGQQETISSQRAIEAEPAPRPEVTTRRTKKRRGRKRKAVVANSGPAGYAYPVKRERFDTWIGANGLAMAIILIILTFDFITPQFELFGNEKGATFFWMIAITWLVGFGITISTAVVRQSEWRTQINWIWAVLLYIITSLFYFFFYALAHRLQFGQRVTVQSLDDVIQAANILANGLLIFYLFLLFLMVLFAITLSWRLMKNLPFWRSENWWLYPPLALAILTVIWFKNVDVVRADIYLKEGERYRNSRQWNEAIALHEKARSIDSDEDFFYLMLALDYQLMAQDGNLDQAQRQHAWQQGEQIALEAREINPYNPDNTGNMGRYYFTLGQIFSPERFQDALKFFEKAVLLAPSNVIYHNLWAQTDYILQDYETAIDKLQTSVSIDPQYPPSWVLLGDTYAAMGNVENALMAHSEAIKLFSKGGFNNFADQFLDQRLNFYISAGRGEDIISAIQQVLLERESDPRAQSELEKTRISFQTEQAKFQSAIGHTYNLQGQPEEAIPYLEQARANGDKSDRTTRELANIYLASNSCEQAVPLYESLLEQNPNDVEAHSALGFCYAQLGNLPSAIQHNQAVIQQLPEDYDSWKNLALLYRDNGQLPEALDAARQAKTFAPQAELPSWDQIISEIENRLG